MILKSASLSLPLRFASDCFNPPIDLGNVRHITVEVRVPLSDLPTLPEALQHKGGGADGRSGGGGGGGGGDDHDIRGLNNSSGNGTTAAAAVKGPEADAHMSQARPGVEGTKTAMAEAAGGSSPSSKEQAYDLPNPPARVMDRAAEAKKAFGSPLAAAAAPAAAAPTAAPATAMRLAGKAATERATTTSPPSSSAASPIPPSACPQSQQSQQQNKQCMRWQVVRSFQARLNVTVDDKKLGINRLRLHGAAPLRPFEGWKFPAAAAVGVDVTQLELPVCFLSVVHVFVFLRHILDAVQH